VNLGLQICSAFSFGRNDDFLQVLRHSAISGVVSADGAGGSDGGSGKARVVILCAIITAATTIVAAMFNKPAISDKSSDQTSLQAISTPVSPTPVPSVAIMTSTPTAVVPSADAQNEWRKIIEQAKNTLQNSLWIHDEWVFDLARTDGSPQIPTGTTPRGRRPLTEEEKVSSAGVIYAIKVRKLDADVQEFERREDVDTGIKLRLRDLHADLNDVLTKMADIGLDTVPLSSREFSLQEAEDRRVSLADEFFSISNSLGLPDQKFGCELKRTSF
jgi:hypothetical protein